MTRIIDLGNGYGRLEGYGSEYASLTFPLNSDGLGGLYAKGYISQDEFQQALFDIGHDEESAAWLVAIASVTVEQWKAKVYGYRTI